MDTKHVFVPKLLFTLAAVLLTIIPSTYIKNLIEERQLTQDTAKLEVMERWGESQVISGPYIVVPYENSSKKVFFLPDDLNISGDVEVQTRERGIYDIPVYTAQISLKGSFSQLDTSSLTINQESILWDQAYLALGLSDPKGLEKEIELNWNGWKTVMNTQSSETFGSTMIQKIQGLNGLSSTASFEANISFKGSSELSFVPAGKNTHTALSSNWENPSFIGAFLPETHKITDEGFNAQWDVFYLNRSFPQVFTENSNVLLESATGINFFIPADAYQMTMRSAKYMVLFVFLTYFIFFFIEALNQQRLHPVQYLLVGFALILFYLLLLSLGEHVGFFLAYVFAGFAIVGVTTLYTVSILNSKKMGLLICVFLSVLYTALFIILQLSDYALLIGTVLLFVALSGAMYSTRRIDWYKLL